jgi:hypothetical protein
MRLDGIIDNKNDIGNFSLSLSISNSNVSADPGLLVLHAQGINSSVPRQSNSMDGTNSESENCEHCILHLPAADTRPLCADA